MGSYLNTWTIGDEIPLVKLSQGQPIGIGIMTVSSVNIDKTLNIKRPNGFIDVNVHPTHLHGYMVLIDECDVPQYLS